MNRQIRCTLILFTTAAIWGFAYVAQKLALGSVGPLTLNTLRGGIAFLFLIPCHRFLKWFDRKKGKNIITGLRQRLEFGVEYFCALLLCYRHMA